MADPRGHSARLPGAFTSLGADTMPPSVSIPSPTDGGVIGAGATVAVVVAADDGYGRLASLEVSIGAGTHDAPPAHLSAHRARARARARFKFAAPAPAAADEMLFVDAQAIGSGGLIGETRVSTLLVPAPRPDGDLAGRGIDARGYGGDALRGRLRRRDDGGGIRRPARARLSAVTPTSITALTPAHARRAGDGDRHDRRRDGDADGPFNYVAPPVVRS